MPRSQHTTARPVTVSGVGLHSGKQATLTLRPAPPNSGVRFRRTDLSRDIPARVDAVSASDRCTILGRGPYIVKTVEHLLSAAYALGVHNLLVEVTDEEIPILDGSALPFAALLQEAGIVAQAAPRPILILARPVWVQDRDAFVVALPAEGLSITCVASYPHPVVGTQVVTVALSPETFLADVAPARTFGFLEEVEALRSRNLALGGSLDNALVVNSDGYSSPLRFPDEIARHKLLDFIGDLALLGRDVEARVLVYKGSHALHRRFVTALTQEEALDDRHQRDHGHSPAPVSFSPGG